MITALVPPKVIVTHGVPYLLQRAGDATDTAFLLGVLSSIPLDWYARRYVEINLVFEILNAFPVPRPDKADPLRQRVVTIAGRLAAVDSRYAEWSNEVGIPVGSIQNRHDMDDLSAELDALVCLLYGLTREQVHHLYATFHRGWNYHPRLSSVLTHYDQWAARSAERRIDDYAAR